MVNLMIFIDSSKKNLRKNNKNVRMIEMKEWFKSKEEMSISFKLH